MSAKGRDPKSSGAGAAAAEAKTLIDLFIGAAKLHGERTAFKDERGAYTYRELAAFARGIAARIDRVEGGKQTRADQVAILLPTIKEFPAVYYGVLLSGRTPVPINFLLEAPEIAAIVKDAGVDTVITSARFLPMVEGRVPRVISLEDMSLLEIMRAQSYQPTRKHGAEDIATLLYTSGTTGKPKGVELLHRNLVTNIMACKRAIDFTEDDAVLGVLPLFHSFALLVTMNLVVALGARAYYLPRFAGKAALDIVTAEGITIFAAVPSMFRLLNRTAARTENIEHSLRLVIGGGEALPLDVAEEFKAIFKVPMLEGYGLTETSPVLSLTRPNELKPGTVGRPLDNLEIGIFDDGGNRLGIETDGEIWARGPSIMRGYRNQPEETAKVLDNAGWFHTGDIGRFDAAGNLKITGRKKEMIISGGENIYPREIEDALTSHPAVFEAAVIGVPDRMRGEAPHAFVSCKEGMSATADELREHIRTRIADYKVPRTIEIRAELPHSPTGKILKRALSPAAS